MLTATWWWGGGIPCMPYSRQHAKIVECTLPLPVGRSREGRTPLI